MRNYFVVEINFFILSNDFKGLNASEVETKKIKINHK